MQSDSSTVVASVGQKVLSATDPEPGPSLLWFAAIQRIECTQDLAGLAPKSCFVSTEAVEREAGQIGKTQSNA